MCQSPSDLVSMTNVWYRFCLCSCTRSRPIARTSLICKSSRCSGYLIKYVQHGMRILSLISIAYLGFVLSGPDPLLLWGHRQNVQLERPFSTSLGQHEFMLISSSSLLLCCNVYHVHTSNIASHRRYRSRAEHHCVMGLFEVEFDLRTPSFAPSLDHRY